MQYVKINGATAQVKIIGKCENIVIIILKEELNSAFNSGCTKVDIDLSETSFIDSSAINEFTLTRRRVGKENFVVRNPQGFVLKYMKTSNLLDWIKE